MFSIKSRKCQEPPRTDKSQTSTNADLQSTYYSTLSTKLDTPRRTLPTIRGRRCSRRMAHSDYIISYRSELFRCCVLLMNHIQHRSYLLCHTGAKVGRVPLWTADLKTKVGRVPMPKFGMTLIRVPIVFDFSNAV